MIASQSTEWHETWSSCAWQHQAESRFWTKSHGWARFYSTARLPISEGLVDDLARVEVILWGPLTLQELGGDLLVPQLLLSAAGEWKTAVSLA